MKNLESLKSKRDSLKAKLYGEDPLMKSFYGGRVGFMKSKQQKKANLKLEREMSMYRELTSIEKEIYRIENPLTRKKAPTVPPSTFSVGQKVYEPFGTVVEVIKINKSTVTVKYASGFKETIKPHLLK